MIFGVVFFGYIIATALALQSNADAQRSVYVERLEGIERFLMVRQESIFSSFVVLTFYLLIGLWDLGTSLMTTSFQDHGPGGMCE